MCGPEMVSAVRVLLANRAPAIDELDSDEAIGLLAPLPADLQVLYGDLHVAPVLSDWWAAIMRRQNDRLTDVFDILMDCGGRAAVRAEIDRRLSGTRKAGRDPLLLLYLAVIRYQEGIDRDSRRFVEVLNSAAASDRERLREGAARLARSATGILREALQSLDFGLLDIPEPVFANFLEELMDSVEAPPDERPWHYEFMDALKTCLGGESPDESRQGSLFGDEAAGELDTLESLISRYELRGVPSALLREVVDVVRTEPEIRRNLDRIARKCKDTGLRAGSDTGGAHLSLPPRIQAPAAPESISDAEPLSGPGAPLLRLPGGSPPALSGVDPGVSAEPGAGVQPTDRRRLRSVEGRSLACRDRAVRDGPVRRFRAGAGRVGAGAPAPAFHTRPEDVDLGGRRAG